MFFRLLGLLSVVKPVVKPVVKFARVTSAGYYGKKYESRAYKYPNRE